MQRLRVWIGTASTWAAVALVVVATVTQVASATTSTASPSSTKSSTDRSLSLSQSGATPTPSTSWSASSDSLARSQTASVSITVSTDHSVSGTGTGLSLSFSSTTGSHTASQSQTPADATASPSQSSTPTTSATDKAPSTTLSNISLSPSVVASGTLTTTHSNETLSPTAGRSPSRNSSSVSLTTSPSPVLTESLTVGHSPSRNSSSVSLTTSPSPVPTESLTVVRSPSRNSSSVSLTASPSPGPSESLTALPSPSQNSSSPSRTASATLSAAAVSVTATNSSNASQTISRATRSTSRTLSASVSPSMTATDTFPSKSLNGTASPSTVVTPSRLSATVTESGSRTIGSVTLSQPRNSTSKSISTSESAVAITGSESATASPSPSLTVSESSSRPSPSITASREMTRSNKMTPSKTHTVGSLTPSSTDAASKSPSASESHATMTLHATVSASVSTSPTLGSATRGALTTTSTASTTPSETSGATESAATVTSSDSLTASPGQRSTTDTTTATRTLSATATATANVSTSLSRSRPSVSSSPSHSILPTATRPSMTPSSTQDATASGVTATGSASPTPSSTLSAERASQSHSATANITKTPSEVRTPSPSPEPTASTTVTDVTITEMLSESRSTTRTRPSASKSFDQPITTTVPLIWRETGALRFIKRPVRFAAPFRTIPVAPTLIFQVRGLAAIHDQTYKAPVGLMCYMRILRVATRPNSGAAWSDVDLAASRRSVWITGSLTVRMVQSVCAFPSFAFSVSTPSDSAASQPQLLSTFLTEEFLVTVAFCANTSKMYDPQIQTHPCNSSQFHVAQCPLTSESVFRVDTTPPVLYTDNVFAVDSRAPPFVDAFATNRSGNGNLVVEVLGGAFLYEQRTGYSCSIQGSMSSQAVAASSAVLVDMCHLRCIFPIDASHLVFPNTNDTVVVMASGEGTGGSAVGRGSILATVQLLLQGVPLPSTCRGAVMEVSGMRALASQSQSPLLASTASCTQRFQSHTLTVQNASDPLTAPPWALHIAPTGCFVRMIGAPDPRRFVVGMDGDGAAAIALQPRGTTLPRNATIGVCDASGNAVPIWAHDAGRALRLVYNQSDDAPTPGDEGLLLLLNVSATTSDSNASSSNDTRTVGTAVWSSSYVDGGAWLSLVDVTLPTPPFGNVLPSICADSNGAQSLPSSSSSDERTASTAWWLTPVALGPTSLFAAPAYAPLCVRVRVGAVVALKILNAADVALVADTSSAMYVTPILSAVDALNNTLTTPTTVSFALNISVAVLQASSNGSNLPNGSAVVMVNGVPCVPLPNATYVFHNVVRFPMDLSGIVLPAVGNNFTLRVEAVQFDAGTGALVPDAGSRHLRLVLWEATQPALPPYNATVGVFPHDRAIRVTYCPPAVSTPTFVVERVTYTSPGDLCNSTAGVPQPFTNTVPVGGGRLVVSGHSFQYASRLHMMCHVSNWLQLFPPFASAGVAPPGAVPATFESSCRAVCDIGPQPYPVNPASGVAFNSAGQLVASATVQTQLVGQFRLRGTASLWSAPAIAMKVVGTPSQMAVDDWASRLQNRIELLVPAFTVTLLDATGNDLSALDLSASSAGAAAAAPRQLSLFYAPQKSGQLNGTFNLQVFAETCQPYNGRATFDQFTIYPLSGEYALTLSSPGLANYILILTIFDNITIDHELKLLSPFPLCFVSVTLDRSSTDNGRFPIPPTIGVFAKNASGGGVDTSVSDVRILASVVRDPTAPLPSFFDGSLVELGVGLTDCNTDYGNCGFLDSGILTFTSLRFTGIPGVWYRIDIAPKNVSEKLTTASFKVRVPHCPVNSTAANLTAALQVTNGSLAATTGGVNVKGWRFAIPESLQMQDSIANFMFSCPVGGSVYLPNPTSPDGGLLPSPAVSAGALRCRLDGAAMTFPGTFQDSCTIKCFSEDQYTSDPRWTALNPNGSSFCTAASATQRVGCCFNTSTNQVVCSEPTSSDVTVQIAAASATDSATTAVNVGTFTFIGPAEDVVVVGNQLGPQTIYENQQIAAASPVTPLDTVIVALADAKGKRLGRTATGDVVAWLDGYMYPRAMRGSPLLVPGNSTQELVNSVAELRRRAVKANGTALGGMDELCSTASASRLSLRTAGDLTPVNGDASNLTEGTTPGGAGPPAAVKLWSLVDGEVSIGNLTVLAPPVGMYDMPIYMYDASVNRRFVVNATVFITPGRPVRVCLAAAFYATTIANDELLDPQPLIYLMDASGNVYQSLRSNQVLIATNKYNYLGFDDTATNANISFRYQQLVALPTGETVWNDILLPSSTPSAEYGGGIDVVQYLFSGLKVPAVHSVQYQLVFDSYVLQHNVSTPLLVIKPCDVTQFAVEMEAECTTCPRGLGEHCIGGSTASCFLCNGSTGMNVTTNYWRQSSISEYAYSCPASSCLGNTELGQCLPGYLESSKNPLCSACEPGYAKDFLDQCVPCTAPWVTILIVVLIVLIIGIVVFAFIYLSVKGAISDDENDNHLIMMLKIFMNHAQVAGMLGEFRVNFTGFVLAYFNFVGAAAGGSGVSISPVNCLLPDLNFLDKMSIQLVLPVLVLLVVAACLGIMHLRRIRKEKRLSKEAAESLAALQQVLVVPNASDEDSDQNSDQNGMFGGTASTPATLSADAIAAHGKHTQNKMKKQRTHVPYRQVFGNASMILIFVLYQTILTQCIRTFNCLTLLTGRTGDTSSIVVLDADVLVECSGDEYEQGLSIAMYGVFIYAIFLPLFTMILVLHQSRNFGWTETYHQFSFLIRGFRLKYWYWEFVVVFRKTGLRLLIATVQDATLQALLGIWFLTALFVLQTYAKPYVLPIHNHADQWCLMTALVTLNIGLAFSTYSNECSLICGIFSIMLIICNVGVIAFLVVQSVWGAYLRVVEEFGIDTPNGDRWISLRNLKNIVLVAMKKQHRMSPSFRTYTPRPLNRALALSILGPDALDEEEEEEDEEMGDDDPNTQNKGKSALNRDAGSSKHTNKSPRNLLSLYEAPAFEMLHETTDADNTTTNHEDVEMMSLSRRSADVDSRGNSDGMQPNASRLMLPQQQYDLGESTRNRRVLPPRRGNRRVEEVVPNGGIDDDEELPERYRDPLDLFSQETVFMHPRGANERHREL